MCHHFVQLADQPIKFGDTNPVACLDERSSRFEQAAASLHILDGIVFSVQTPELCRLRARLPQLQPLEFQRRSKGIAFESHSAMFFFSHNKSANNTFYHGLSAK
jgi:hypothetical protein